MSGSNGSGSSEGLPRGGHDRARRILPRSEVCSLATARRMDSIDDARHALTRYLELEVQYRYASEQEAPRVVAEIGPEQRAILEGLGPVLPELDGEHARAVARLLSAWAASVDDPENGLLAHRLERAAEDAGEVFGIADGPLLRRMLEPIRRQLEAHWARAAGDRPS